MTPEPFPHAVIDGLFDPDWLTAISREFPDYRDPRWITYGGEQERGKKAGPEPMWGEHTDQFMSMLSGQSFILTLEDLTGIGPLTADTLGGGMHVTGPDGRLDMHCDFADHPNPRMAGKIRKINLLVFLNPVWEKEWGGALYLGKNKEIEVLPLLNRTAVFETSGTSWHGHPDPIVGNHYRRSLACYYYVDSVGSGLKSTVWL